jgi:general secretion pathway protein H
MLPAGNKRQRAGRGYTLIELLVVILIFATVAVLLPSVFPAVWSGRGLHHSAGKLTSAMRVARTRAIASQRTTGIVFTPATNHYWLTPGESRGQLESTIAVRSHLNGARPFHIQFYPDGSASGDRVVLVRQNSRVYIDVNPLTGRVSIND